VLASFAVHAAAAMTIGGVLGFVPRSPGHERETPDVDVALDVIAPGSSPAAGPAASTAAQATVTRRRPTSRPVAAAASTARSADRDALPARFALSAGTVATNLAPAAASAGAPAGGASRPRDVAGEAEVDVPARLVAAAPLAYPPAARQAEIEADLPLDIVVDAWGRVVSARAVRPAGYGLDEAALRAIRGYRFSPALRSGRPVAVRARWTIQFRLR
jgi:protein TonB